MPCRLPSGYPENDKFVILKADADADVLHHVQPSLDVDANLT